MKIRAIKQNSILIINTVNNQLGKNHSHEC